VFSLLFPQSFQIDRLTIASASIFRLDQACCPEPLQADQNEAAMSTEMASDPFSSKNILRLPLIVDILAEAWHGFQLDNRLESQSLRLVDVEKVGLPELTPSTLGLSFDATSVEAIDSTHSTTSYQDLDDPEPPDVRDSVSPDDL